jgi:hypothetical protein
MTPVATSTRTTLNPTAPRTLPARGAWSPNCATNAWPTWPKAGAREKSKPSEDECTANTATGLGGTPGDAASSGDGVRFPGET